MALRVTQSQIYAAFHTNVNKTLASYSETGLKVSSQKIINRPSDDPVGAGRLISLRASGESFKQYDSNIKTAMGWLGAIDNTLSQEGSVQSILSNLLSLAEQGASGTYKDTNREQIGSQMRAFFQQLITNANADFGGSYLFGGHKSDSPPYTEGLGVTTRDSKLQNVGMTAEGSSDTTVIIQATSSGPAASATYRYSKDGGKTWQPATVTSPLPPPYPSSTMRISAGGADVIMETMIGGTPVDVTAVDPNNQKSTNNGTWLFVHPTAIYHGDDNDTQVVTPYGSTITAKAEGAFLRDVAIKINKVESGKIFYSYSVDDGANWIDGTTTDAGPKTHIPVPGGSITFSEAPKANEQYIIHPRRADINLSISDTDYITINMVGKDVFGGRYQDPSSDKWPTTVDNGGNMFETIGKLVAYAESNDQQGMGEMLPEIKNAMKVVLTHAALAGGRKNRIAYTHEALEMRKEEEDMLRQSIEDADAIELMTQLAKEKTAYTSVLQSSSMIMQISLLNYL